MGARAARVLISDRYHVLRRNDSARPSGEPYRGGHWEENGLVMPVENLLEARLPRHKEDSGNGDAAARAADARLAASRDLAR